MKHTKIDKSSDELLKFKNDCSDRWDFTLYGLEGKI